MGSVVAVIPARYESTRLPGKPLVDLRGQPMIRRVYERTARAAGIDRVLVATDDARVRAAVEAFGGTAMMTRREHTTGTDRIAEVARDLDAEVIVNVQGDLPLLDPEMVAAAVAPMRADTRLPMATLKTPIRDGDEFGNPNVVKVTTDRDGFALYFSRSPIPFWRDGAEGDILGHRHIGLYVYRRDFLLSFARLEPTPLERAERLEQLRAIEWGFRIRVVEVAEAAVEVDTMEDLERARALLAG
jgi:3-deoxy-manno-octulosonate cytidylyltransferase (CMP-KDO synthetase)